MLRQIMTEAFGSLIKDELDIMSVEVREILSNPKDAEAYIDAIDKIESGAESVVVNYGNGKQLTLINTKL